MKRGLFCLLLALLLSLATAGLGEAADYEKTTYPLPSFSSLLDCVQENDIVD